jgi:hypothetical protein
LFSPFVCLLARVAAHINKFLPVQHQASVVMSLLVGRMPADSMSSDHCCAALWQ